MERNKINEELAKLIREKAITDVQGDGLIDEDRLPLEEGGFDSLDLVELVMDIEREFNIAISDDKVANGLTMTMKQLVDLVDGLVNVKV